MELQPITFEKTDELREELREYDQDSQLIDGLTAAASLSRVINVAKIHESPRVISGGVNTPVGRSVQELLF